MSQSFTLEDMRRWLLNAHGDRFIKRFMDIGEVLPNCGLEDICPEEHFPVHVYSEKGQMPKICVSGKYVILNRLNRGGRGINIAVVDSRLMTAVNALGFDTFAVDSTELEMFLTQEVHEGDIIIAVTFDDASKKLGSVARYLLEELGSGKIQNINFRDEWYFISQKGISGYTPYEDLHTIITGSLPINIQTCVPRIIKGKAIVSDLLINHDVNRAEFCQKYSNLLLPEFCSMEYMNVKLQPAELSEKTLKFNEIYITPLIVIGDHSLRLLSMTLETVIRQLGIRVENVLVVYNQHWLPDAAKLISLFGFHAKSFQVANSWELISLALETAVELYPTASYLSLIEEGNLLTPDYMPFMGELLPVLKEPTIMAISAWNPNGFVEVSSNNSLLYRIEDFPGIAFTLTRELYLQELKGKMAQCCKERSWNGWLHHQRWEREIVIPDVSRVFVHPLTSGLKQDNRTKALLMRQRKTSLEQYAHLKNKDLLLAEPYEKQLSKDIFSSYILKFKQVDVIGCEFGELLNELNTISKNYTSLVIPYIEKDVANYSGMKILCKCFALFYEESLPCLGLHRGMMRFSVSGAQVFIVSSRSPHFKTTVFGSVELTLPLEF